LRIVINPLTPIFNDDRQREIRNCKIALKKLIKFLGDLWGPFVFCLMLAVIFSSATNAEDNTLLFEIVFIIVWVGAGVISINGKLLGGKM
jgi:hypothetical protein